MLKDRAQLLKTVLCLVLRIKQYKGEMGANSMTLIHNFMKIGHLIQR
jgi:hypothetical protein